MNRRYVPLARSKQLMYQRKIGILIAKRRQEKGLTQEELALTCETSQSHVGKIERGEQAPGLVILLKIAYALNCKVSDFTPFP